MSDQPQAKMPKYKCHKEVWALKIRAIIPGTKDVPAQLIFADKGFMPKLMSSEYMKKHNPYAGGYFVVYKGGYLSFSPAEEFEEGYSIV